MRPYGIFLGAIVFISSNLVAIAENNTTLSTVKNTSQSAVTEETNRTYKTEIPNQSVVTPTKHHNETDYSGTDSYIDYSGPTESITDYSGTTESTTDYSGPTESTTDYSGPTESITDYSGTTESIKNHSGTVNHCSSTNEENNDNYTLLDSFESITINWKDDEDDVMLFPEVEEEDLSCNEAKVDVISPKLLVGEDDVVRIIGLNSTASERTVANKTGIKSYSVDYHYKKKFLFFIEENRIVRASMVGDGLVARRREIATVTGPTTLAVDWVHDQLYWMTDGLHKMEVSGLDGSGRADLLSGQLNASYPNNIAVDPYAGLLFIVNNKSIFRAELNGSDFMKITVSTFKPNTVRCLALDRYKKKIYFFGWMGQEDYLAVSDYNGKEGGFLLKKKPSNGFWDDVLSIDIFRNQLVVAVYYMDYWNRIEVLSGKGSRVNGYATDSDKVMWAVKVYHPNVQRRLDTRQCLHPDSNENEDK